MAKVDNGFMVLKIELKPTGIVRTISVPSSMTLLDLNEAIQSVMGWENAHLWHFQDGDRGPIYELPHEESKFAFGKVLKLDASQTTLRKAFPRKGSKLTYEYDFGDSWDHLVTRMADPKVPEIACLESEGPDGWEDFGGQWRLAEFIEAMRKNPDDESWGETREWVGLDDEEWLKAYLAGESAAVKTEKLREALADVKVELPPKNEKATPKMSDEEQAHMLGLMFATTVPADVWAVVQEALENGGSCEFFDTDKTIATYLLTMFDGLKVKDGVQTPFCTNPSRLKVHKKWVDWYGAHKEDWQLMRGPFDLLEDYASAAVHLYGAIDQVDLYELIKRYDPGYKPGLDETLRYLEARALWTGIAYRQEGKLFVNKALFVLRREDLDVCIKNILKAQKDYPRWYPANREELFKWVYTTDYEHTPEVDAVRMVLGSLSKLSGDMLDESVDTIHDLMANGLTPDEIYRTLVIGGFMDRISTKPRQHLIDALEAWQEIIHTQALNGNTIRDLRAREAQKAAEPKISRNAPCPCGSGKKYKLCCGKGK